jgi:hypothetical protein
MARLPKLQPHMLNAGQQQLYAAMTGGRGVAGAADREASKRR